MNHCFDTLLVDHRARISNRAYISPAAHLVSGLGQRRGWIFSKAHGSPGDVLVGAHQDRAGLFDFAQLRPVVALQVGDLATGADHHCFQGHLELLGHLCQRRSPRPSRATPVISVSTVCTARGSIIAEPGRGVAHQHSSSGAWQVAPGEVDKA